MFLRSIRFRATQACAARRFSAQAAAAVAAVVEKKAAAAASTKSSGDGRDTLGRRLMSLVYAKRSAVIAIRKWKEEGHTVRKYDLNRIVRQLRKLRRYKHALEICEWMTLQQDIRLQTALLHVYVQNKLSAKAEALMAKMTECGFLKNSLPYNHMLSLYISNGQLEKVPGVIHELKKNTLPDVITYNLWLTACASQNDVETAEKVFLELKKENIVPDWVTYSALTNLYIKKALPEKASYTLKQMEKKAFRANRAAYSSLLSLHTNMGDKDEVHRIWKKMISLYRKMSDAEYTCMLSSLVKLGEFEEAESLYREWETVSGTGDARVSNILLAAYINRNQMEMAENFYNQMVEKGITPSYTTWELLTWGYLNQKQMEKVLDYFTKAVGSVKKWNPDERLVREVFKKYEEQGNVEGAEKILVVLRKAGHLSTEVYNSLLRTYAKAGKMPLIVAERMEKDKVWLNEETHELIKLTSKMCVSEASITYS
nr:pentatricopeptide repeat-containing protein, mitochondrial [Quercus suber]